MSRQDVIRAIVARDRRRKVLTEKAVRREAKKLHAAGCEHFGSWDTALRCAGIILGRAPRQRTFTAKTVKLKLRFLCGSEYDMEARHSRNRDYWLYDSALKHFGGWEEALAAAGINPHNVRNKRSQKQLDQQQVLEGIRRRHELGLSLLRHRVCFENNMLALAASSYFSSWDGALAATGCAPENESSK